MAARLALGLLDKPYADINPEADLKQVRDYLDDRPLSPATRATYRKGLNKLADYLRHRLQLPIPETATPIPTELPPAIADSLRQYLAHRRRTRPVEQKTESMTTLTYHLTGLLRRLALNDLTELTPARWFDYVDRRLQAGIAPTTLNRERHNLRHLLQFLQQRDIQIIEDFLLVEPLGTPDALPRDVPVPQTKRLLAEIGKGIEADNPARREAGLLDQAWVVLMLHSGLRTGEIRRLRLGQLNQTGRCLRVEGSKGNADRMVYLSREGVEALTAYLPVRGSTGDDHVFTRHHHSLPVGYCGRRLRLYGSRYGVRITPHQLRHTAATALLNAGASILTVQRLLGHERLDTTLRYTRLYDRTVAGDYHSAMVRVEGDGQKSVICDQFIFSKVTTSRLSIK